MDRFVSFAKQFSINETDKLVIERAKLILLDSITAMALGNKYEKIIKLTKSIDNENAGQVPLIGTNKLIEKRDAAFINGIAMVSNELDEGNPKAKGHPAAHFLPALLSLSMTEGISGAKLLKAFIVNYEISARLGETLQLDDEIHPHGNWGVFGNGFGVGTLLDWIEDEHYIQAAMLSSSFSFPTLWKSVLEGHEVRNVIIGLNNYNTMLLPHLINARYTASISTGKGIYGGVLARQVTDYSFDFEEEFYLLHTYFKFYPYCRFCHAPIDATLELIKNICFEDIKSIHIDTYSLAAKLNSQEVANSFAGMFSIPYALAQELYKFYEAKLDVSVDKEQIISELMKKIIVTENEQYTKKLLKGRITAVKIELSDGTFKEKIVDRAKGDADEAGLYDKVLTKNQEMLNRIFGETKAEKLIENLLHLDELENVSQLSALLVASK